MLGLFMLIYIAIDSQRTLNLLRIPRDNKKKAPANWLFGQIIIQYQQG